jgi:hypothetical protein
MMELIFDNKTMEQIQADLEEVTFLIKINRIVQKFLTQVLEVAYMDEDLELLERAQRKQLQVEKTVAQQEEFVKSLGAEIKRRESE